MSKGTILAVEPDEYIRNMLQLYFTGQGYPILVCDNYQDAIESTRKQLPSVVLTEIDLPDKSGWDLIQDLRAMPRTLHIPIIVLTTLNDAAKINTLKQAIYPIDDYLGKPFDIEELKLRIQNAITPAGPTRSPNPVSGFPTGRTLEENFRQMMQQNVDWVYLDLKIWNFEAFRGLRGWQVGETVIKNFALIITDLLEAYGTPNDFAGHPAGDYFVILTESKDWMMLLETLKLQADSFFIKQYSQEEQKQGYMLINERKYPLMSLSYGVFVAAEHPRDIDIRKIVDIANNDRHDRFGDEKKVDDDIETEW